MTTINALEVILAQVNGNSICSIDTETIPQLLGGRKNPMQGEIRKVTIGTNVMVFQNKKVNGYDAMVRRRLEKEGKDPESFVLSPRQWGQRIENTPFVEHNGEHYLEVICLKAGKTHYMHGARPIEDGGEQGGLENKVVIRSYKFSSIRAININGVLHIIR